MRPPLSKEEIETIRRMRIQGARLRVIAERVRCSITAVHNALRRLETQGSIDPDVARSYAGRSKTRLPPSGPRIESQSPPEERLRIRQEVERGGYSGYNELFLELFRDWMAEKEQSKPREVTDE